ncbi:AMP-binding protein [Phyllobacterium sp. TAF24]|uniref:AMP-binding protein n=1 Tax=Phyllobacterium sp. TAF24 TaxID=3233068 RepID=UPI003F96279E
MDRIWTKQYPAGVPAEVDIHQYSSVVDLFEAGFEKHRGKQAYVLADKALTYGDIDRFSLDLAVYLQALGLRYGDRVAIMLPNVLQYPIATAAILRAGFIIVNVNPLYTPRELEHQLKDSGANTIIVLEQFAGTLEQIVKNTAIKNVVLAGQGDLFETSDAGDTNRLVGHPGLPNLVRFNKAVAIGHLGTLVKPQTGPDDIAVLQYTGGTTGVSKGAVLQHRAIIASALIHDAWLEAGFTKEDNSEQRTVLCALPLYHIFAFIMCGMLAMRWGSLNVLIPNARDIPAVVKEISRHKVHCIPGINTFFKALINDPNFADVDFTNLQLSIAGGMAADQAVARKWLEVTGCPITEGYGLSETTCAVVCNVVDSKHFTGTIGVPVPNVDVKLIDDNGDDVTAGETGEIAIRSPQLLAGYFNRPEETKAAMTADGFFKSGDIGSMDEHGYIKIVDRKKDMILVSGFNVFPSEIESVALLHPAIRDCAVVGIPDERSSEAVVLFAVRSDPALTEDELRSFCARNLTGYKRPKYIQFCTDLPLSNVGKVLRRQLRDEAVSRMQDSASELSRSA